MARIIKTLCVLACAIVLACAQNNIKPITDHSTTTTAANASANTVPLNGNVAISVDQKTEAVQAVEKSVQDKRLISTVPETWTPMGFTGGGLPWNPFEALTTATYSINTPTGARLPPQLVQQQQEHSYPLQQQHNIFGSTMPSLNADLRLGQNQDAAGGQNQNFVGGNNMLQTMLLMQLLSARRDVPDPQSASLGQQVSLSPLEELLRLEEIRMMRGQQIDRTMGNIRHSKNQRGTQATLESSQNNRRKSIIRIPGPANVPDLPNYPRFINSQTVHPEAMDSRNITPNQGLASEFVEPVAQDQAQTQNTDMRSDLRGGSGRRRPPFIEEIIPGRISLPERSGVQRVPMGPNYDLRNIAQVIRDTHFQRNLRTFGTAPGATANSADVRADQADLMSDYIDNLQSMSPFQRILNPNPTFGML